MRKLISLTRQNRAKKGAVIVELCFCVVFILTMLFGLIQYGLVLHAMQQVQNYSRECARFTAANWNTQQFNSSVTTSGSYLWFMNQVAPSTNLVPYSALTISITDSNAEGTQANIAVSYNMTQQYILFPYLPGLPKPWTFTSRAYCYLE